MKKWIAPSVEEMNIAETAYNWLGNSFDGGYVGDGQISGHLEWKKPVETPPQPPVNPDVDAHS